MNKIVLITGATSGFGKSITEKFAAGGWNCIICGRRKERLEELSAALRKDHSVNVLSLCFDIRQSQEVMEQIDNLPAEWRDIEVLVNNAGLALGRDSFEQASLEDWEVMIDTNVKGLLYVSKAVVPIMIKNKKGHIINIGSISGKEVYPDGNVYCATKHAVDAISKSQRIDLLPYGIKVTAIHPGAAETEFSMVRFKGDPVKSSSVYKGYQPLYANDIADITWYCANLPPHVCINDLVVTCTAQANSFFVNKEIDGDT